MPTVLPGLTQIEAARLLIEHGRNELPPPKRKPAWQLLVAQLIHFFALLLWVAAVLAFVAGMPQLGIAIAVVIVVNGLVAFVQERGATRTADALRDLMPRRVLVRRDHATVEIDAAELVPGDLMLLRAGDAVSADGPILEAHSLSIDTSTLTGESVPTVFCQGERIWAGTLVTEGEANVLVELTGSHTRLAGISQMTSDSPIGDTPLARQLRDVVRIIAIIAVSVGVGFFALSLLIGTPAADGFLFAVGVTVALVPEGLLPTVTVSLAIGARRMAARNAVVRRLEAVATLGSTTFICTDKTGTLTQNRMEVIAAWTPVGEVAIHGDGYRPDSAHWEGSAEAVTLLTRAATAGRACSLGRVVEYNGQWRAQGDPLEAALDALARRLGDSAETDSVARFPFDARRRCMSIVVVSNGGYDVLVKGAPEAVLALCTGDLTGPSEAIRSFTERGLRTLALAVDHRPDMPTSATDAERDLKLLAIVGLQDPPRTEAAPAIATCRHAGIRVAMLTGDHPATARSIAREVGLLTHDVPVLIGAELPTDDEVLGALVDRDGLVVARVSPEDKLRIARVLRQRGHIVAMTGDGVNDGPALSEADIGIAMGQFGTDVARNASDLVLLDDNFATIVEAIVQGRATFANLKRFLTYHLTDNVAELVPFVLWALSGGRFPLAIGVMQVLSLDIGTDLLPALALGAERPAADVLDQPPWQGRLLDRVVLRRAFGALGPTEAFMSIAAFVTGLVTAGWRPGDVAPTGAPLQSASGAAFTAIVVGQMANAYACRSASLTPRRLGWRSNRLLQIAVVSEIVALVGFLFIGPVARALGQRPAGGWPLVVALASAPVVLAVDSLEKRLRTRRGRSDTTRLT